MLRVVGVEPVHVHVVDGEDQVVPPAGFHDAAQQPHLSAAPLALDKGRGKYGDEEGGRFERLQYLPLPIPPGRDGGRVLEDLDGARPIFCCNAAASSARNRLSLPPECVSWEEV
jgi:hypothetical protein